MIKADRKITTKIYTTQNKQLDKLGWKIISCNFVYFSLRASGCFLYTCKKYLEGHQTFLTLPTTFNIAHQLASPFLSERAIQNFTSSVSRSLETKRCLRWEWEAWDQAGQDPMPVVLPSATEDAWFCPENNLFSNICEKENSHIDCGSSHKFNFVYWREFSRDICDLSC